MRPTTLKLGIFNPAYVEFDRFLYLDLTLVLRQGMTRLLADAFGSPRSLVVVDDWHHDGVNSSVMCIQRGALRVIYDEFAEGRAFEQRVPGDQDFINGVIDLHNLHEDVATFESGLIDSFKRLMRLSRHSPALAQSALEHCTVVKFHGSPRMDDVFAPWGYLRRVRIKELACGHWRPALPVQNLRREWRCALPTRS